MFVLTQIGQELMKIKPMRMFGKITGMMKTLKMIFLSNSGNLSQVRVMFHKLSPCLLPPVFCIEFKVMLIAHHVINRTASDYLFQLIKSNEPKLYCVPSVILSCGLKTHLKHHAD